MFSQEYHFDYFIKKKNERLEKEPEKWGYGELFNSENGIEVFFKTNDKKIIGVLNDNKNNTRHIFRVTKNEKKYNFFYKHSNKISISEKYKNLNKENVITVRKIDSLNYKIFVYKNSTLKKVNQEVLITLAQADFNYLKINADYNRNDDMETELKSKLPNDSKFVINKIQYLNARGKVFYKTSYEIMDKIDFLLNVPEKLIFKESDYWSDFED